MDRRRSRKGPDPKAGATGKPDGGPQAETGRPRAPGNRSPEQLLAECRVDTFRAGGPGGQHQNKVESGVRLTHLPTGVVATSRRHRSQVRNRAEALRRLAAELEAMQRRAKPRIPTSVPEREKRRRLEEKKRRSRLKKLRGKPGATDG